jgi:putative ABC transport system permease protein
MRTGIRQALRRSLRAPGFALAVLLLVAAVVAVNATAFSALHALRWKALPYHEGDRLVELQANLPGFGFRMGLSEPLYEQVRTDGSTFSGAVGFAGNVFTQNDEAGNGWRIQRITHDFDQVLGVGPILGRAFGPEDAADGREGILLISSHIWNSRFDASPEVIGRALKIGKREYTIVGVMPPSFVFPSAVAHAWMPYVPTAAERTNYEQGSLGDFEVAARLAPGASPEQALERLGAIMANSENLAGLRQSGGLEASVRLWRDRFAGTYWQSIALLQLAALFLLIVVAANVGNLVLDRVVARQREISVCRALGARRRDVALSVSADVVVPGVLGVMAGLLLVPAGIKLLRARQLLPNDMPVDVAIDVPTIVAAITVTLACLASSLVVALKVAHASKSGSLNERATMSGLGRARIALLIGQVTLCTALVGGAGLLLRSAVNVVNVDPGFRADGVVVAAIDPMGYARGVEPDVMSDPEVLAPQLSELLRHVKAQLASPRHPLPGRHPSLAEIGYPRSASPASRKN